MCLNNKCIIKNSCVDFLAFCVFRDFIDGHVNSLITEMELEKSLQHQEDIADEIECIEKTLLKRRTELREADRLLAEAENELENTRGKVILFFKK